MTPLQLCDELYDAADPADRCYYLGTDEVSYFCRSPKLPGDPMKPDELMGGRRLPCCHFSLQLWCLAGPERWAKCELFVPLKEPMDD